MESLFSNSSGFFVWVVLPALIFIARTFDMSLGTLRVVFIAQGRGKWAALTGFFEATVWLLIVSQALQHISNPLCVVAYAAGYAAGNVVGLRIEERLALGMRLVRVIVPPETEGLAQTLRDEGFGVTTVDGQGREGTVKILFTLVRRRNTAKVLEIVSSAHPEAFVTIEEVRQAAQGFLPKSSGLPGSRKLPFFSRLGLRQRK